MGQQYTLLFVNNSKQFGNACIYQQDPGIGVPNVMSLAWFSKPAFPTTTLKFTWEVNYCFVWSDVGEVTPGVVFEAQQTWEADLSTTNFVTLSHPGLAYTFQDQQACPDAGTLFIKEDDTIPLDNGVAVGIGMSGVGTFVVPAQTLWQLAFTPHPNYYITFGTYQPGEILDSWSITNAAVIIFPPNVYSMTAILNADNTWTVLPTSSEGKEPGAVLS